MTHCSIVPPYLIARLVDHPDADVSRCARATLAQDPSFRASGRQGLVPRTAAVAASTGDGPQRTVSDAGGTETLPGRKVRGEGDPDVEDVAVNEAYAGLGDTWQLYWSAYQRDSLDGAGLPLLATVHYGQAYDNAFFDGTQMVFGDGDGKVFGRFTGAIDVIGHELTHGVTQYTADLTYQGQSGALNESVSDVFGSLVKQQTLGQSAADADWLIGAGLFTDEVQGVALRSMKAPGTAYDDDVLGKDPQPADMSGYVETADDNGGVHINSGIPNHAFFLAATAIGGNAWEGAGAVWYDVLTGGRIAKDCDFAAFASLTVEAADARFGAGSSQSQAIAAAWQQVGVTTDAPASADHTPSPQPAGPPPSQVTVVRSGGLAGLRLERTVDLDDLDEADAAAWRSLLASPSFGALAEVPPVPDSYLYRVVDPTSGLDLTTAESALPGDVRDLFGRTLRG